PPVNCSLVSSLPWQSLNANSSRNVPKQAWPQPEHAAAKGGRPYKMTPAKLRLAMASMGQPGTKVGELCKELGVTRQTLYRHVSPTGQLRPDGERSSVSMYEFVF